MHAFLLFITRTSAYDCYKCPSTCKYARSPHVPAGRNERRYCPLTVRRTCDPCVCDQKVSIRGGGESRPAARPARSARAAPCGPYGVARASLMRRGKARSIAQHGRPRARVWGHGAPFRAAASFTASRTPRMWSHSIPPACPAASGGGAGRAVAQPRRRRRRGDRAS